MIEREIKIKIKNPYSFIKKIEKQGAKFLGFTKQTTYRFDTKTKDLEKQGKFLRTRTGFKSTITLKKKIGLDKKVKLRKEIELEISDIKAMNKILKELGFNCLRVMEKYRAKWKYKGLEITLDELPFGIFCEIEGPEKMINRFLKKIHKDKAKRITETYWKLHKKQNKKDIIFKSYKSKLSKYFKDRLENNKQGGKAK